MDQGSKRVTVVGLGKSGLSAARLCLARGSRVRGVDQKPERELPGAASLREAGATLCLGGIPEDLASETDLLVVSPGVPLSLPPLRRAREAGVPLWGEIELAYRLLQPQPPRAVGITGTNGKSTTTALAGALLSEQGRMFVGGNLGRPWTEAAMAEPFDLHLVELSSFQLEGIEKASFHGAALLNLTPDHLDRYPDPQAYAQAKSRIFLAQSEQDFAVVNADDQEVLRLAQLTRASVYGFTLKAASAHAASPVRFRGLARAEPGGFRLELFGSPERFTVQNLALRGEHNLQNAMAASLLARLSGASAEQVQRGLDGYPGLPHRLESVRTLEGVEWVNDSKATNVDSSLVALRAFPGRLWLIAGGKGKGAPYQPLVEASRSKVLGVLTLGEDAPALEAAFRGVAEVHCCGTLEAAVSRARELARAGEVVLLSPACASYDQFRNFEHRGETFKRLVKEL